VRLGLQLSLGNAAKPRATVASIVGSSLEYWGDPSQVVIETGVRQMTDQSGKGRHPLQTVTTKQPVLNATGAPGGTKPCITYDGADDFLTTSFTAIAKPAQMFVVAKFNTVFAANSSFIDGGNANRARVYRDLAGRLNMLGGSTGVTATGLTETAWHLLTITFNAASSAESLKEDGTVRGTNTQGVTANTLDGLTLGSIGGGSSDWWSGSMCDVIISSAVLTAPKEAALVALIKAKYPALP